MDEFFKDLDRDYDDRLSFGEFLGEESHIEKIFKNMDKNGDGFVTKTVKTSGLRTDKTRKFSGVQKCVSEPDNGSGGDCLPPV